MADGLVVAAVQRDAARSSICAWLDAAFGVEVANLAVLQVQLDVQVELNTSCGTRLRARWTCFFRRARHKDSGRRVSTPTVRPPPRPGRAWRRSGAGAKARPAAAPAAAERAERAVEAVERGGQRDDADDLHVLLAGEARGTASTPAALEAPGIGREPCATSTTASGGRRRDRATTGYGERACLRCAHSAQAGAAPVPRRRWRGARRHPPRCPVRRRTRALQLASRPSRMGGVRASVALRRHCGSCLARASRGRGVRDDPAFAERPRAGRPAASLPKPPESRTARRRESPLAIVDQPASQRGARETDARRGAPASARRRSRGAQRAARSCRAHRSCTRPA